MGCWNATCGLTNLPIFYGDEVVAMIIQEQDALDYTPSYAWSRWSPASVLVRGQYDDYGDVELDDHQVNLLKLSQDDAAMVSRPVRVPGEADGATDDEKWSYAMVRVPTFVAEELPDEGHRSVSRFNQRKGSGFSLWMAHAGVFDQLCRDIDPDDWRTDSASALELAAKQAEAVVKADMESRDLPPEKRMFRMDDGWSLRGEGVYSAAIRAISSIQRQLIGEETLDQKTYDFTKKLWVELHCLNSIMSELRITLSPLGSAGSQNGDMDNYAKMTAIMGEHIHRVKAEQDA